MSFSLKAEPIHFLEVLVFPLALISLSPSYQSIILGLFLAVLGLSLKLWLFAYPKKRNKKFEVYGPYRFLRHPYFCSTLILLCSAAVASRSLWLFAIFITIFVGIFLRDARKIDEKRMRFFGGNYAYYKNCISSLIPSVYPYPAATRKDPSIKNIFDVRYKAEVDTFLAVIIFYGYVFTYSEMLDLRPFHGACTVALILITLFRLGRLVRLKQKVGSN